MGPIRGPGGGAPPSLGSPSGGVLRSGPNCYHRNRKENVTEAGSQIDTPMLHTHDHLLPLCVPVHQAQGYFLCMSHLHYKSNNDKYKNKRK